MVMPVLQPIPIRTKNVNWFKAMYRWLTTIRKWELTDDWEYTLDSGVQVIIPKGFTFDGASIPRVFWGILSPTGLLLIPGLLHDHGYRYRFLLAVDSKRQEFMYAEGKGRAFWDRLFRDEAIRVNGFTIINYIAWLALVCFGWVAWRKRRREAKPLDGFGGGSADRS